MSHLTGSTTLSVYREVHSVIQGPVEMLREIHTLEEWQTWKRVIKRSILEEYLISSIPFILQKIRVVVVDTHNHQ